VTFDPTPPSDRDSLGRGGDGIRARLGRIIDTLRFQWSKWVIDYDLASQLELFTGLGDALKSAGGAIKDAAGAVRDTAARRWWLGLPLAGGIAWLLLRRRRRRGAGGAAAAPRRARARSPIAESYDRAAKLLARGGTGRDPALTPRELAARMQARGDPGAGAFGELVELYYAAEWGARTAEHAEPRARALVDQLRAELDAVRKVRRSRER